MDAALNIAPAVNIAVTCDPRCANAMTEGARYSKHNKTGYFVEMPGLLT
jgi:hypothetical protein